MKGKGRPPKLHAEIHCNGKLRSKCDVDLSNNETKALERDLNPIQSQLDIRGRVLLAVSFVRDKAQRNFELFPEVICGDCTSQTNKEHRPLFLVVGKDNSGKSFVAL